MTQVVQCVHCVSVTLLMWYVCVMSVQWIFWGELCSLCVMNYFYMWHVVYVVCPCDVLLYSISGVFI